MFCQRIVAIALLIWASGAGLLSAHDLRSVVQSTLTSNPELKAADANFKAFAYELLQQKGEFEPTVTLFGDVGEEYVNDPAGLSAADNARAKTTTEIGVVARLPLFDGYRRANQVYASAARVDRSSFELLDASETMALMVAEQYINVARQQLLLGVAQQNLTRLREIMDLADNLVEGGRIPFSDLLQVESSIFAAQATIAEIRRSLDAAKARYRALVGEDPKGTLGMPSAPAPPNSVELVVQESLKNSYRLKVASTNIEISKFEREIADSEFRPQLSLNAGGSYGRNLDGASGEEDRAFIGLELSWTLYGGGRRDQRLSLSERTNEAMYQRMSVMRDVEELARIAWSSYFNNSVRSGFLASRIESNSQLVDSYAQEFQAATRSLLDLLIAENGLVNAQFEQVNTRAILAFAGYRALAAQSKLATYFGVNASQTVLSQIVSPQTGQKPLAVIRKGQPLVNR